MAVTVCAAGICCALLSAFVSDGSLKRILSLVMGAFMVCSLLVPVKNAVAAIRPELEALPSPDALTASADEAVGRQVVAQTRENLKNTLTDLLRQNGIETEDCEIILAETEENRIIIGGVRIYIKGDGARSGEIDALVRQNFGVAPDIETAE